MYVRRGWKIPYGKHIGEQYLSFNVNKECLIQDLSFFNFLKISGTKVILDSFFGDWILPRSIQISKNFYLLYKETKKSTFVSPIHLFSLNETKYLFIVHPKAIKKLKKEIKVVLVEYKIKIVIETGRHGLFQLIGYKSISIIHVVLNISRFLFILEQYVEVSTFKNNPIIIIRMGKYTQYKAFLVFLFDTPDYLDLWMKFQFYKVKAIGWINRKLVAKHWNTLSFPFIQPIICTFEELEQKNVKDSIINAFIYVINKGRPLSGARIYLKDTEEDIGWIIQSGFCKFCSKSFGYGFVKKYFFRFINIYFMNPRSDKIFKAILMTKLYKKNEIYHTN